MRNLCSNLAVSALGLLLVALGFLACNGGGSDATPTASPAASASPSGSVTPTPKPVTTEAGMELDEFVIRPDTTRAGPGTVVFTVTNSGEFTHEFLVINTDLPNAELPRRAVQEEGVDETKIDIVGRLEPIAAGEEGELTVDMGIGAYVIICNLASNGASHYLNGMYNSFTVEVPPSPVDVGTPKPSPAPSKSP